MAVSRNPIIWAKAWGECNDMSIHVIVSLTSGKFLGRWNIWQGLQSSLTQKWYKEKISPRKTNVEGPLRENCLSQDIKTRTSDPPEYLTSLFPISSWWKFACLFKARDWSPFVMILYSHDLKWTLSTDTGKLYPDEICRYYFEYSCLSLLFCASKFCEESLVIYSPVGPTTYQYFTQTSP